MREKNSTIIFSAGKERVRIEHPVWKAFLLIVMLLPDDFFAMFSLYKSSTPSFIAYKWLSYSFGVFLLIIILAGILTGAIQNIRNEKKYGWLFLLLFQFIRETLIYLGGGNSIFTAHAYEIYLTLIVGIAAISILSNLKLTQGTESFFWFICYLNVATIFIQLVAGSGVLEGRFHAINLDMETTGTLCGIVLLHLLAEKKTKFKYPLVLLFSIALLLSGSRVNLLLTVFFFVLFALIQNDGQLKRKKIYTITMAALLLLVACFGSIILYEIGGSFTQAVDKVFASNRMLQSFSTSTMSHDGSVLGRTQSISIGLDILKNNPLGISGYFINLQTETVSRGFPTFPHCALLDFYLLIGPMAIVLFVIWVKILFGLWKKSKARFWPFAYMIVFLLASGGPIVNFKIVFFYGMLTLLNWNYIKTKRFDNENGGTQG